MISGYLGNTLIGQCQYQDILNQEFYLKQQGQQSLERSKLQFGVPDPIQFITVKCNPPQFKGNEMQTNVFKEFDVDFGKAIDKVQIPQANEIDDICQKSKKLRDQYNPNQDEIDKKIVMKMAQSIYQ
ncbi:protein kinase domain protein [Ichthyophthirius multifiliis]|uniref:Protein kinase domain protein n=1 Tax=Ichthyophthirius multifiliis TaxID=5932 RepID=G0QPL9_ICHMU|nr:protein kinase domain protein [Ichthyophthirius multifiliis]EGR32837.1 protein kinase domain protein [Ichthyophthirius multifiliis]|eukprot:XP_004036823.1 protein kinase domain protein [Ichthyophthirius multifiliis]